MNKQSLMLLGLMLLALLIIPSGFAQANGSLTIGTITPNTNVPAGTPVSFQLSTSGFVSNPNYILSDAFPGSTISNSNITTNGQFNWTPNQLDVGAHNITITASDQYGDSSTLSQILIIGQASPVSIQNLSPGSSIFPNNTISFAVAVPGFVNPVFSIADSFQGSSLSSNNISSAGNMAWSPNSNDVGIHNITVNITGDGGRADHVFQTITVEGIKIQPVSGTTIQVGTPLTFTVAAYGLNSSGMTYTIGDSLPNNSLLNGNFNGNNFAWIPQTQDIGTHLITVNATDINNVRSSATINVTVLGATPTTPSQITTTPIVTSPATSPATSPTTGMFVFTKALKVGSTGTEVKELQKRLTTLKYYSGPITGYYGSLTKAAVIKLQKAHKLTTLGSVGPGTRAVLNK